MLTSEEVKANRRKVEAWLDTFRPVNVATFYMLTDQLIYLQTKQILKDVDRGLYLTEAIGDYARYRLGVSTVGMYMSSPEGTPFRELQDLSYIIIDHLSGHYYSKNRLNKLLREEMERMAKFGHVKIRGDKVFQQEIVPEEVLKDFWGDLLHSSIGKSSWKRSAITTEIGLSPAPIYEIANLMIDNHSGDEYGITPDVVNRWWDIHGPGGSDLAFMDKQKFTYLQYKKAEYPTPVELGKEAEVVRHILKTIRALPNVSENFLKKKYGITGFVHFVEFCKRCPGITPLELADSYITPGLAYLIKQKLKTDISQHHVRSLLTRLYDEVDPRLDQINELGDAIRYSSSVLATRQRFRTSSDIERDVMNTLTSFNLLNKLGDNLYEVKIGMDEVVTKLNLFTGNLFAGKKERTPEAV